MDNLRIICYACARKYDLDYEWGYMRSNNYGDDNPCQICGETKLQRQVCISKDNFLLMKADRILN